ncbi:carboxymuconolactone decarboxylase family protein [Paraburkholderia steynii]|nr:carboxymuconolactone decarboxylase family protein [Paraburkholderia steynii]
MDQLPQDLAEYLGPRVKRLGYLGELFKCAGNAPDVILQFMHFTDSLKEALPDRLTELGALTVAGYMQNDYERNQHERLSVKLGFSKEWIAAVNALKPNEVATLSEVERAAQRYALAALQTRGLGADAEFAALSAQLPPSQAMAFVMLIGRYVTHALVVNTLHLRPPVPSIFE